MPDSGVFISDDVEVSEFTITVASECYSGLDLVRDALNQQPSFNSAIVWGIPCTPKPEKLISDAELVLLMTDRASLQLAIDRLSAYRQLNLTTILIYLQDDEVVSAEKIPGQILPRLQLPAGFSYLTRAVFAPIIPQGLVCVDWADTRHVLVMDGQIVMEEAVGARLKVTSCAR